MMRVTLPSRSMRMNAFGAKGAFAGAASASGRWKPTTRAPPTASPACRNPRRVSEASASASISAGLILCSMFDRLAYAHVGAAAADISRHGRIDIGIFRVRGAVEQGGCRHDLSGLAVAALDDLQVQPRLLYFGTGRGGAYAFDGGDCALSDRPHAQQTGAHRCAVHMHGAGAAQRHAASELGAGKSQNIAQYPQQRHVGRRIDIFRFAVDPQTNHWTPRQ